MLRRKEDGKLKAVENTSSMKRKIPSWMLCGLELFPWPLLELVLIVKEVLGAVFGIFWTSLGFAQSKFLRRPLVPRFYKVSTMALPGDTSSSSVSVQGTTIGNHIKPLASLVLVAVSELLEPWEYFLGSAKAEF